jgi:hypothetical protein
MNQNIRKSRLWRQIWSVALKYRMAAMQAQVHKSQSIDSQ